MEALVSGSFWITNLEKNTGLNHQSSITMTSMIQIHYIYHPQHKNTHAFSMIWHSLGRQMYDQDTCCLWMTLSNASACRSIHIKTSKANSGYDRSLLSTGEGRILSISMDGTWHIYHTYDMIFETLTKNHAFVFQCYVRLDLIPFYWMILADFERFPWKAIILPRMEGSIYSFLCYPNSYSQP